MYYKIMHNDRVIDVLENPTYIRFDKRHKATVVCKRDDAEGFLSSDRSRCFRARNMRDTGGNYELVDVAVIDKYEYDQLRIFGLKTPQDIIDAYTLTLVEGGII